MRLLFVTYHFLPADLPPARRADSLRRELERRGATVDVVTSRFWGGVSTADVQRTGDLRELVRRARALPEGMTAARELRRRFLSRLVIPDVTALTWLPSARRTALALVERESYDAVLTTSPVESAHLVGRDVARRGVPWVADLRDGWTFERPTAPSLWPRLDRRIEVRTLRHATALTAATEPLAEDLRRRVPGAHVVHLPNAVDGARLARASDERDEPSPARFTLVYTGTGRLDGKDVRPFLDGLRGLIRRRPDAAEELEVLFAGTFAADELAAMHAPDLAGVTRFLGRVPHERALGLQRAADGLLLVLSPGTTGVTTGKVVEYLLAGKPILAVGEGAGAELVGRAGATVVASTARSEELGRAVESFVDRWRDGSYAPPAGFDPTAFTIERNVDVLVDVLTEAGAGEL